MGIYTAEETMKKLLGKSGKNGLADATKRSFETRKGELDTSTVAQINWTTVRSLIDQDIDWPDALQQFKQDCGFEIKYSTKEEFIGLAVEELSRIANERGFKTIDDFKGLTNDFYHPVVAKFCALEKSKQVPANPPSSGSTTITQAENPSFQEFMKKLPWWGWAIAVVVGGTIIYKVIK